jgi:hypothetical protein
MTHVLSSCDEPRTLMCSYFLIFMSASVINLAHHATCFPSVHTHALLTYSTPHMLERWNWIYVDGGQYVVGLSRSLFSGINCRVG